MIEFYPSPIAIRIIDSTNKINQAIFGGLVKHDPIRGLEDGESKKESVMPTGLVFDPRTQGIFFNSQAGFLQLFDPLRGSMIFNVRQFFTHKFDHKMFINETNFV